MSEEDTPPESNDSDLLGTQNVGVTVPQLMARYHALAYDAAHAIHGNKEGISIQAEGRQISYHLRPHPKVTYTEEQKETAKEIERIFGQIKFRQNTHSFEELKAKVESLQDVIVQRGFAKHSDPEDYDRIYNANTRDTEFKPYRNMLNSMNMQEEKWRTLVKDGTGQGEGKGGKGGRG